MKSKNIENFDETQWNPFFNGSLFFNLRAWDIEKLSVHGRIELVASQRYIQLRKEETRGKKDYILPRHVYCWTQGFSVVTKDKGVASSSGLEFLDFGCQQKRVTGDTTLDTTKGRKKRGEAPDRSYVNCLAHLLLPAILCAEMREGLMLSSMDVWE